MAHCNTVPFYFQFPSHIEADLYPTLLQVTLVELHFVGSVEHVAPDYVLLNDEIEFYFTTTYTSV